MKRFAVRFSLLAFLFSGGIRLDIDYTPALVYQLAGILPDDAFAYRSLEVEEAGGAHRTREGVPFAITGGNALPFTAARDEATARRVAGVLAGGV